MSRTATADLNVRRLCDLFACVYTLGASVDSLIRGREKTELLLLMMTESGTVNLTPREKFQVTTSRGGRKGKAWYVTVR